MEAYPRLEVERAMKVQEVILRAMSKQITWWEAAEIVGVHERTMRRWRRELDRYGYTGLLDRRSGQPSPRRVPVKTVEAVLQLYREKYYDFNVRHFHQKLVADHGIELSYTWVKKALQGAGLVKKRRDRSRHRKRRARRPLVGMMLHIDGSPHQWFQDDRWYDLIVILDDATSEIYYAQLVEAESTRTVMRALREVIESRGLFCSLYSDRASHFFQNPKKGEAFDRRQLTQVGRALKELGIEMIPAFSPQARGRSERSFGTWQGRLPQELRIRHITDVEQANRFLRDSYVQEFNRQFAISAAEPGTAFVPLAGQDLDRIFSLHHERLVQADNTIRWGNLILQIEPSPWRLSMARCRVIVYEHLDNTLSIGYGPQTLGRYTRDGRLIGRSPKVRKTATAKKSALEREGPISSRQSVVASAAR
jgi:transposase